MSLSLPTPNSIVIAARASLMPCGVLLAGCILGNAPASLSCSVTFVMAALALSASPKLRNGEVLGGIVILVTLAETLGAGISGNFDAPRWAMSIAVVGAIALLLRIQNLRTLARQDPYVSLRQLERRNVTVSRARSHRY